MKTKSLFFILSLISFTMSNAQNELPYYEIPDYDDNYSQGAILARMVDGLGFRFYWATESLRPEDLSYKPSEDGRTASETIDHIVNLSQIILNTSENVTFERPEKGNLSFEDKRSLILFNLKKASENFKNADNVSGLSIKFTNGGFPLWNLINGPIEDAVWHCGQLVSFRRASGNPLSSKPSFMQGKVRE